MNKEELVNIYERFAKNKDFMLNPDKEHLEFIIQGILTNEKKFGMRLCPCRVRDGTKQRDLELICPCNFKSQEIWTEKGACWCGLFVKREKF